MHRSRGQARIDVRAVAPDAAAAYQAALAADLRPRQMAADQLVADLRIGLSPSARSQLAGGEVDTRLPLTLATLAASEPIRITAFTDAGPGAGAGTPLGAVEFIATRAGARHMLAFCRAQRLPYLPAGAGIAPRPGGGSVLTVDFAAPSPFGLLGPHP